MSTTTSDTRICHVCSVSLEYSMTALLRGYCDVCAPSACPECECVNIEQRLTVSETSWKCDNGCNFEVPA